MFSTENRCLFKNNQLAEVICQLRFPEILMINEKSPAAFQDAIRDIFPNYSVQTTAPAPRISGAPGNLSLVNQPAINNYQFVSADGVWKINLTSTFISLSCNRYFRWEDFAAKLDKPLAAFIECYRPAYFQRVGLRYVNFISRKALALEHVPFSDLFQSAYLGPLGCDSVAESTVSRCSIDAEVALRGGCRVKLHAGPGLVKKRGQADQEVKFIFDEDLFMSGNIPVNVSAGALETLHAQAYPVFRGAITDTLFEALSPITL